MNNKESYSLGLKIALHRFTEESDRREALDTKASLVLGFSGVLIAFLFDLFIRVVADLPGDLGGWLEYILLTTAITMILLAALFSVKTIMIREYRSGPGSSILTHWSENQEEVEMQKNLLRAYALSYQNNWAQNQGKYRLLHICFVALGIGTIFAFLSFIIYIWI